ncbi:MAG: helix-turn-helix domain-containing protein [Spirochaetes bacterium]|nr:helix-turn-helix domain-containing protein [Spirochaetota bacterium]
MLARIVYVSMTMTEIPVKRKQSVFALALILLLSATAYASTVRVDDGLAERPIGQSVEFLEDEKGTLSIENILGRNLKSRWVASNDTSPGFGFTESVFWVRLTVSNDTGNDIPFFFEHGYPLVDYLELYVPQKKGTYQVIKTGDRYVFSERPVEYRNFVFPLVCEARTTKTLYLRQKTSSAMNFPLTLWSPAEFRKMSANQDRLLMFYYGMMAIMVVNYIFIYLLIRHLIYLNFSLFILSIFLFIMTQMGGTFQFLMPNNPELASICPPFFLCMANLFGNRSIAIFMQLKKNAPIFKRAVDVLAVVFLVALASVITIPLFGQYKIIMTATSYLSVVTILLAFSIGLYLTARKQRSAYIFTLISLGFLCGSVLYLLKTFGFLPGNFLTTWSIVIGSATLLVFLSIAMVDRINTMRKGLKIVSQNLEKQVKARSIELLLTETAAKIIEEIEGTKRDKGVDKIQSESIKDLINYQRNLTITKLSQDMRIVSNMDEFLAKAASKILEIVNAGKIYIFMENDGALEMRSYIDTLDDDSQGYSAVIVDDACKGEGAVFALIDGDGRVVLDGDKRVDNNRSVMAVPMVSAGSIIGACYCERGPSQIPFSDKDIRMVSAFLESILPVFENALSYREKMLSVDDKYKYSITSQTEEKIKQALAYIEMNYTSDISRENLAASLDISPNHLGKFFKVHTGKKINEYINELRISDAARMLREQSDENIINIAFSVGFESLSTFNRAFLKVMGVTPTEYKEKNRSPLS